MVAAVLYAGGRTGAWKEGSGSRPTVDVFRASSSRSASIRPGLSSHLSSGSASISSHKPQSCRYRSSLPAAEHPEIRRINVVHHHIRILPAQNVDHRDPHREHAMTEPKLFFHRDRQASVVRKPQ